MMGLCSIRQTLPLVVQQGQLQVAGRLRAQGGHILGVGGGGSPATMPLQIRMKLGPLEGGAHLGHANHAKKQPSLSQRQETTGYWLLSVHACAARHANLGRLRTGYLLEPLSYKKRPVRDRSLGIGKSIFHT